MDGYNVTKRLMVMLFRRFYTFIHLSVFQVIDHLSSRFGPTLYTSRNVVLSATHTHSGPGGYLQYVLFNIVSKGFVRDSFDAIVKGVTRVRVL